MPTELEELIGFIASPNPQVRLLALDHALGFTKTQPSIFKVDNLKPIQDLKTVCSDVALRSKLALTALVNLADDLEIRKNLVEDEKFVELMISKITDAKYPNADLVSMVLANLSKSDEFVEKLISMKTEKPPAKEVSVSRNVLDQFMDLFVRGAERKLNEEACYDFLSYLFADIARVPKGREYFVSKQEYDGVVPISKMIVFTEHSSAIRRRGVASTIKNCLFHVPSHAELISESGANLLPYLLLPLCGPDDFSTDEALDLHPDLQFLPPDKERESDDEIIKAHLESLLILTTTKEGREALREVGTYPVIRELHLKNENEEVREAVDRIVQVIMADEPDAENPKNVIPEEEDEDDDKIEEIC